MGTRTERRRSAKRPNVEWAWEFLRLNSAYIQLYRYWSEGLKRPSALTSEQRDELYRTLERTGFWARRFRPWLDAALQTGYPHVVHASEPTEIGRDAWKEESQDRIAIESHLDPMQFCLNKWLDPNMSAAAVGVETLKQTFDPNALVVPPMPRPGSSSFESLERLGLIDVQEIGGRLFHDVLPPPATLRGDDGTEIAARLPLQFDLTLPLLPQLQQAHELLSAVKGRIQTAKGGVPWDFYEIQSPDEGGIYSEYLFLLEQSERLQTKNPNLSDEAVTMWLLQPLNAKFRDTGDEVTQSALIKQLKLARHISSSAYRQLAFMDS